MYAIRSYYVMILEYLEKERDEALRVGTKREAVEMTAAERETGLELLRDPRLFDRVASDLTALGYVGEELNKHLLYLRITSYNVCYTKLLRISLALNGLRLCCYSASSRAATP